MSAVARHERDVLAEAPAAPVLEVDNLTLRRAGSDNPARLVQSVSFSVAPGECLALIGESGCGKTLTSMAILGLLPKAIQIEGGSVALEGTDILGYSQRQYGKVRGRKIGAIFQDPMSSLNPTMKVGDQIAESRRIYLGESRRDGRRHALELLASASPIRPSDSTPIRSS